MSIVLLTEPFSGGSGSSGTVTSVDVSGGTTGLTTTGGPVTTAGVITLAGVLNVANGGTGTATPGLVAGTNVTITGTWPNQTINSSGGSGGSPAGSNTQIQFNASGSFGASPNLYWDGFTLFVGGNTPVGGLTNPIGAFVQSSPNYIQTYTHNDNAGTSASSDFVVYPDNGSESAGWGDFGVNSSGFADSAYSVTGPNETYIMASGTTGKTGNLVYATDSTGTTNAHQWYVGGFTQAKSAWKMQLTSGGLQLSTALSIANGGTGQTTANAALNALLPTQTGNTNYYLKTDGTNTSWSAVSGTGSVTQVSVVSANGFAGTVATDTTTPAITLTTTVTGILKGNGTVISAATAGTDYLAPPSGTSILKGNSGGALANAVAGTDYQAPITLTTIGTSGVASFDGTTLNIPQYSGGGTPGGSNTQIQFNNSGSFGGSANLTWDGTNVQLGTQGALRFADADSSNYVAFKAASTIGSNVTWTLPNADATVNGYVLSSNAAGTLSWVANGSGGGGSPNLDGGTPTSNYGGITAINGGVP